MLRTRRWTALLGAAVLGSAPPAAPAAERWPAGEWTAATPESQGLDSGVLAEMLDEARRRGLPIHSVLIVRHGALVLDAAFHPYTAGQLHDVASVTKSVTSLLIGIALDQGLLPGVQEPVVPLLPASLPAAFDPRLRALTLEHLLTMTSGLDCGFGPGEPELAAMRRSPDWVTFGLALPLREQPGSRTAYCSVNNHLLSAVLSAHTGGNALAFARRHLFAPLGIRQASWPADPQGRSHGWGDLRLTPHDLAKIAYLYLRGGRWDARQVVSEQWVRRSVAPHVRIRDSQAYGYSWWINTEHEPHIFEAIGRGGQRAAVLPASDMVVVFNGGGLDTDELAPYLFRAIRGEGPLPENPEAAARLRVAREAARRAPPAVAPAPLPALARAISGRGYLMEPNAIGFESFRLTFDRPAEAQVSLRLLGRDWSAPVGLDGPPRFAPAGEDGADVAVQGRWLSDRAFLLDLDTVTGVNRFLFRLEFEKDGVQATVDERTGEIRGLPVRGRRKAGP